MGLFGKKIPATELDSVQVTPESRMHTDSPTFEFEKADEKDIENAASIEDATSHHIPHVDQAAEKRLIKKLDRRLIPLVMGLCTYGAISGSWITWGWIVGKNRKLTSVA